jgi:hypothetical protein
MPSAIGPIKRYSTTTVGVQLEATLWADVFIEPSDGVIGLRSQQEDRTVVF